MKLKNSCLKLQVADWPYKHINLLSVSRQYAQETSKRNSYPFTFINYAGERPVDLKLSYQELDRKARQIAALLQSRGQRGQRVLLLYPAGLDYLCAFFGCLYASMIAVPAYPPLNPRLESRLSAISEDCGATIALTTRSFMNEQKHKLAIGSPLSALHWCSTDESLDGFESAWGEPSIGQQDIAFLQYTSGSTGRPKGVIVTHGNLIHNLYVIALHLQFQAVDHHFTWLPPYHDMGLIGAILGSFTAGVPLSFITPVAFLRRPERWLLEISSRQCTISGAPNFAYEMCIEKITEAQKANLDLSSWTLAYSGAEPVRSETLDRFAKRFEGCGFDYRAFYPCYGMAETTLFVTGVNRVQYPSILIADKHSYSSHNRIEPATGNVDGLDNCLSAVGCGKVAEGLSVEIVDPTTQLPVPDRTIGEIWVNGPSVAAGYWNRNTETEKTFQAQSSNLDGYYLRTGDLGFIYNDELYISGRLKDLIIVRGVNHYPQDIEATVNNCHPLIKLDSGIAFSTEISEEERLVFVQEFGSKYKEKTDEVFFAIRNSIANQHDLQVYKILLIENGRIPKTTSGKLSRHPCREKYLKNELPIIDVWENSAFSPDSNSTNLSIILEHSL